MLTVGFQRGAFSCKWGTSVSTRWSSTLSSKVLCRWHGTKLTFESGTKLTFESGQIDITEWHVPKLRSLSGEDCFLRLCLLRQLT